MIFDIRKKLANRTKKQDSSKEKTDWAEYLSKEMGISKEEAQDKLDFAEENYGISESRYCKQRYFELSETAMAIRYRRDKKHAAEREEMYDLIKSLSGKDKAQVLEEIKFISDKDPGFKVNVAWYFATGAYMIDVMNDGKALDEFIQLYQSRRALRNEIRDALDQIDKNELTYEDIEGKLADYRAVADKTISEGRRIQRRALLREVPEFRTASDEDLDKTVLDMEMTKQILEFKSDEYIAFHFWDKTLQEKREYVSSAFRFSLLKGLNDKEGRALLDNKYDAYVKLSDLYKRDAVLLDARTGYEKFLEFAEKHPVFVKKNNCDSLGRGVQKVDMNSGESPEEIYKDLTQDCRRILLEELIHPAPEIRDLNPDSVNTVRIVVYCNDDKPVIESSFMKIGRAGSFVDNGGAGGIFVHVDSETGTFDSAGIDEKSNVYEEHPDHGYRFRGITLPDWEAALKTAVEASRRVTEIKYIGWDLTFTENREWVIVEGNSKTHFFAQQMTLGRGVKKEFVESIGHYELRN